MTAAFIEAMFPPDAATYSLLYSGPGKLEGPNRQWGMVVLSISHPGNSLEAVPLRQMITAFSDWMMGSKIHLDWLEAGKHKGYDTQRYTEGISNEVIDSLRSCFAFVHHRNQSAAGRYGQRLWGYHCRYDDNAINDDVMIENILSAISVR